MIRLKSYLKFILLAFVVLSIACDKDNDALTYDIPSTYNFANVDYSGQTQRLSMLNELKSYMNTANTSGVALDATRMKAMYANNAANAQWAGSYDESKQLKSKTFEGVRSDFEALIDEMAAASQSTVAGSEGVSGVIESADGAKKYLVGEKGVEYTQLIEKGLMGACFFYQSAAVYFGDDKMGSDVDNETVIDGEGTEMEHHWDEALGYFGVPIDFPTSTDGLFFWGGYCNGRDALLNTNQLVMDGFLKGRAAISNNDLATRNDAIAEVRDAWELVTVGTALHYINSGIANFDDMALRSHNLSEAIAFVYAIQFNPTKQIDNGAVSDLLTLIAGSSDFASMNLYNTSVPNLQQAKDDLAAAYELEAQKDDL